MAAYIEQDSQFFTRRGMVVVAILLLHLFILWALVSGLAHHMIEAIAPPVQAVFQPEEVKNTPPPPPPPPTFERPPVEIPPTDTIVEVPQAVATTAISNTTTQHVAVAAPVAKAPGRPAGLDKRAQPDPADFYPASARRNNEEGVSQVHSCVGANGKLSKEPIVEKGSGNSALDAAAIQYAKALHYVAATEDGKPVDGGCFSFNVRFKLK
jgi:protein TonB